MESFDAKRTSWEGLWWHNKTNYFSSAAINLKALKDFKGSVRLFVRKNSSYENGKNGRPNYVFSICDAKAESPKSIAVLDNSTALKIERLKEVLREAHEAMMIKLQSESYAVAGQCYEEAIDIIKDITGEEWEFRFCEFG